MSVPPHEGDILQYRKEDAMKVRKNAMNEYKVVKGVRRVSNIITPDVKYPWQ